MAPPRRTDDERELAIARGTRIRDCRRARGLKASEVAARAGIREDHLLAVERGKHLAYEHTYTRIAKALRASVRYILTGARS